MCSLINLRITLQSIKCAARMFSNQLCCLSLFVFYLLIISPHVLLSSSTLLSLPSLSLIPPRPTPTLLPLTLSFPFPYASHSLHLPPLLLPSSLSHVTTSLSPPCSYSHPINIHKGREFRGQQRDRSHAGGERDQSTLARYTTPPPPSRKSLPPDTGLGLTQYDSGTHTHTPSH